MEQTTINDLGWLANNLSTTVHAIALNPKFKAVKQQQFRLRSCWKQLFKPYLDNAKDPYIYNIFHVFYMAVGYSIERMDNLEDTLNFIDKVIDLMYIVGRD